MKIYDILFRHPYSMTIDSLSEKGEGIGMLKGKRIRIKKALPGDTVTMHLFNRDHRDYLGVIQHIDTPSTMAQEPACSHFFQCGGCTLQRLSYIQQVQLKTQWVHHLLQNHLSTKTVLFDCIPCNNEWHYRNKMEFAFGKQNNRITLGLHEYGKGKEIVDITKCLLIPEIDNRIITDVRNWANDSGLEPYEPMEHHGFLRFLVSKRSHATNSIIITIVTTSGDQKIIMDMAMWLKSRHPHIAGIHWLINDQVGDAVRFSNITWSLGASDLIEKIGETTYRITPDSFFQTNSEQVKLLYDRIKDLAELSGKETVYDLFCGTGGIGLYLAPFVQQIIGIEVVNEAILSAQYNARQNNRTNMQFFSGDVRKILLEILETSPTADLVILDPPRGGIGRRALEKIARLNAPKVIYVSCNPFTLAQDLDVLLNLGYQTRTVTPVDMFPQTYHVETIVTLNKTEGPINSTGIKEKI